MKTRRIGLILLAFPTFFLFCHRPANPDPAPVATATDYEVYSAILNQDCSLQTPTQKVYLIDYETIKPDSFFKQYINDSYRQDSVSKNSAWQQFVSSVDSSQFSTRSLSNSFASTCYRTQLLTEQQKALYLSPGASRSVDELKKEINNFSAILRFSSIAYSADRSKAVCYRVAYCGFDCAWGNAYFIERRPVGWAVVKVVAIWTT